MPKGVYERKPMTDEMRAMYSRIAKERGYGSWLVGKKQAAETIEKRRANNRQRREKYGYYHTPDGIERMRAASRKRAAVSPRARTPLSDRPCERCDEPFACKPTSPKRFCSRSCIRRAKVGADASNWKGGESLARQTERHIAMSRQPYREWRAAVFARDDYTCQMCRLRGVRMEADHIEPWSRAPELRYEVTNGRTLCVPCHRSLGRPGRPRRP
jgi:5-methylcytosine-specific restriction endonuclease McrA